MLHAHAYAYANSHAHANSDAAQRLASYAPHRAAVSASDGPDAQTQAGLHLISRATSPTSHRGGGPWAPFDGEDPAQAPPGSLHLAQRHPRLLPTGSVRGGPDARLCRIVVGRPRRHAAHKPRRPRIHERRLRRCNTPSVGERRRLQRRVACVQHTVDRRADIPCLRPLRRSGGPTRSRARRLVQRPRDGAVRPQLRRDTSVLHVAADRYPPRLHPRRERGARRNGPNRRLGHVGDRDRKQVPLARARRRPDRIQLDPAERDRHGRRDQRHRRRCQYGHPRRQCRPSG